MALPPPAEAPEMTGHAVIACDVFAEELRLLGGEHPPWRVLELLEMGLHDRPDELRREIQNTIHRLENDPCVGTVLLLYGLCGNGLVGVRPGRARLVLPRAHDCISILLGGCEQHSKVLAGEPGTYFYSPGWIREKRVPGPDREAHLRKHYGERFGDDPEIIEDLLEADREAFSHHNRAAYVDLFPNDEAEAYSRACAHCMGWRFERLRGDPALLRGLFAKEWDPARYLLVEPGQAITLAHDGTLVQARP
ncbi:MAG: DUF1638 domain-containing protein [Opitutales bacterium]|nr:DUF1638 domain-containing protein [Opitutales bacterium]